MKYVVALDGRRPKKKSHNNQPKTGGRDGGDYRGEAGRAGGAGEARYHHFDGIISCRRGKN